MDLDGQAVRREHRHLRRADAIALQLRDGVHDLCCRCKIAARNVDLIRLGDLVRRVHEAVCDLAVIRQNEQPLGIQIQPADRIQPLPQ